MRTIRPFTRNGIIILPSLFAIAVAMGLAAAPMSEQALAADVPDTVHEPVPADLPAESTSEATTPGSDEDALPVAENVDLSEPVNLSEELATEAAATPVVADGAGSAHRPAQVLETVVDLARRVVGRLAVPARVRALCVASVGEEVVLIDRAGAPVGICG